MPQLIAGKATVWHPTPLAHASEDLQRTRPFWGKVPVIRTCIHPIERPGSAASPAPSQCVHDGKPRSWHNNQSGRARGHTASGGGTAVDCLPVPSSSSIVLQSRAFQLQCTASATWLAGVQPYSVIDALLAPLDIMPA